MQVVEDAKVRLRGEILSRLQKAKKQGDHSTVLRFTKLYAPLGLQVRLMPLLLAEVLQGVGVTCGGTLQLRHLQYLPQEGGLQSFRA